MVGPALTSDTAVSGDRRDSRLPTIAAWASVIAGVAFVTKFTMIFSRGHAVGVEWPAGLLFLLGMLAAFTAIGVWAAHTVSSRPFGIRVAAILGSLVVLALATNAVEQTQLALYPETLPEAEFALLVIGLPALAMGALQLWRRRRE